MVDIGAFQRLQSGLYVPPMLHLSPGYPCATCCDALPCSSCQDGTTQESYGVTLAGFTSVFDRFCGDTLNDEFELQQTSACTWLYTFPNGLGEWSLGTIDILVGSRVRVNVAQFGFQVVAVYYTGTAADWDCGFSGFDVPWISGWDCGNVSTCTINAA